MTTQHTPTPRITSAAEMKPGHLYCAFYDGMDAELVFFGGDGHLYDADDGDTERAFSADYYVEQLCGFSAEHAALAKVS